MTFDTNATNDEERKIALSWIIGLPRPQGLFGFTEITTLAPSYTVTPKGGTVAGGLEDFCRSQLYIAYPNMSKTWDIDYDPPGGDEPIVRAGPVFHQLDSGPDRLGQTSIKFRIQSDDDGLILFPGIPNGTAANQVMDDLFGPFKVTCTEVLEEIITERLAASAEDEGGKVTIALSNADLPRVINGKEGDPVQKRPFMAHFSRRKIVKSVKKLGLYPIDVQQACKHPKVRDDTVAGSRAASAEALEAELAAKTAVLAEKGFAVKPLQVKKRKKKQVESTEVANIAPLSDYEKAYTTLVEQGVTVGTVWATLGAVAFNSPQVLAPELARINQANDRAKLTAYENQSKFIKLQTESREIHSKMISTAK
eukprot:7383853-Prymnesium_polylepis.1